MHRRNTSHQNVKGRELKKKKVLSVFVTEVPQRHRDQAADKQQVSGSKVIHKVLGANF